MALTNIHICLTCGDPVQIEIESETEEELTEEEEQQSDENYQDADVELRCGCHFHWECFLETYSVTRCPNCSADISSVSESQQQVLCTVRSEGGVQTDFDILPTATEEAYLRTFPEERKAHAFLQFCREGDLDAVLHMIKDAENSDEEEGDHIDLLQYCGTFEGIDGSGLHVAIKYSQVEIVWLLLVVGTSLDWSAFPTEVLKAMDGVLTKEDRRETPDIRTLRDSQGRTALDLAQELAGPWMNWVQSGHLNLP